jgi:hypothetical protein
MKVTSERNSAGGFPLFFQFFLLWIDAMAVATNSLLPMLCLSHFFFFFSTKKSLGTEKKKNERRRRKKTKRT